MCSDRMRLKPVLVYAMLTMVLMSLSVGATYLTIVEPVSATINNGGGIYLGKVAPGESISVEASPTTSNALGVLLPQGWDTMEALNLPNGWTAQPSPKYSSVMKLKITVSPNATNGTYAIGIRAVNLGNYSGLGNLTVAANVTVTPDVYNISVYPANIRSGIGQPVNLYIAVNNSGASDDPFVISSSGLPAWNASDEVISLHGTNDVYTYPVFVDEPGVYNFNISVKSTTSPLIHYTYKERLVAQASLLNDWNAVGQGAILSPIILEPAYAFMNFLAQIYGLIVRG